MNSFLLALLLSPIIDAPWLLANMYYIKDPFYTGGGTSRLWAAIPVYIAIAYLITKASSATEAFYTGAAAYAIYDFTVLAFRSELRLSTAVMDTLWGGTLFALTYLAVKRIQG